MPVISAPYSRRFIFTVFLLATTLAVQSQTNGLLVTYSINTTSRSVGNGDSTAATGEITDNRRDVQTVSLDLNGSFKVSNQRTARASYYDLKNETITVASKDTLYSHLPLHYVIDYRWAEYQNRIYLTNLISKAGIENPFGGYGNLEMIFGIEFKENKVRESILEKKKNDTTIFEVDGIQLVKIHYAPKPLALQFSPSFSKYLTYETELHPSIKEKIITEQKVPDYIEYFFTNVGSKVTKVMRLENVKAQRLSPYPSVSKLPWEIRHTNSLDRLLDSVSHYTTLHAVAPLDSVQCFSEADQLSGAGNNLSAILRLFEYLLQSGHTPTTQIRKIGTQQDSDPILKKFFTCLVRPTTKEEAEVKITRYRELIALNKEYGYIMNIFLANYLQPIDLNESQENFHVALKHNPFITGAYVDLGKAYANQYDYATAWQCFDIALKLNSNHPMTRGILANMEKLKADFPQYFNTK